MKMTTTTLGYLAAAVLRDKRMLKYQTDPERWLIERFGESPNSLRWSNYAGYEDHEWDGTPNPFLVMFECLAQKRWLGIESATSTGKTYMLPRAIYWFLDCFPNSLVVTTAPKQQQLKAVLWSEIAKGFHRFKKIRPKAEMFSMRVLPDGSMARKGGTDGEELTDMWSAIGVVSGVSAGAESATKMQGYHRENMLFVIEEAAGVPNPVFTAIKNTCTGPNNLVIAVGNPDAATDALHQFCSLDHVEHIRISAFDHPNVVTKEVIIPGAVTQNSIDQRASEYGADTNFFKSRVRGIAPEQGADALIRYAWLVDVTPAMQPEGKVFVDIEDDYNSVNALGVDVANSEQGDMACLAWGRRNHLTELHEFQCPNANDIAYNVIEDDDWLEQNKHQRYFTGKLRRRGVMARNVGVDAVGVGVGTINAFTTLGYNVKALQGGPDKSLIPTVDDEEELGKKKEMYAFNSLRSQMYFVFAQELQKREFSIEITDKRVLIALFKELVTVKQGKSTAKIQVEGKPEIKKRLGKSPNMADAAVYWNWMRKQRHPDLSDLPIG
jgi:phage terminase large subunit